MIETEILRQLGWSDELIERARDVAQALPKGAPLLGGDQCLGISGTATSGELDLSGLPVGSTELFVTPA